VCPSVKYFQESTARLPDDYDAAQVLGWAAALCRYRLGVTAAKPYDIPSNSVSEW
jgi:hypothetical protein